MSTYIYIHVCAYNSVCYCVDIVQSYSGIRSETGPQLVWLADKLSGPEKYRSTIWVATQLQPPRKYKAKPISAGYRQKALLGLGLFSHSPPDGVAHRADKSWKQERKLKSK